jgi:hypothetical protein
MNIINMKDSLVHSETLIHIIIYVVDHYNSYVQKKQLMNLTSTSGYKTEFL